MSEYEKSGFQRPGLSRRSIISAAAAAMAVPAFARPTVAFAQDKLAGSGQVVVFSWGGPFTKAVRQYIYEPFTAATGIKVVDVIADIAEPQVKAMNEAGRVDWDIACIQASTFPSMNAAGMFAPIDYTLWDPESIDGISNSVRLKTAVPIFASATIIAYDKRVFGDIGPKNWSDFWNVKAFPGPRSLTQLPATAKNNLVFGLLADGVAKSDVWPLTDDKLDRSLKKFDEIRQHIPKWWTAGNEAPQLLINREVVMTSTTDGRALSAIRQGAPIQMVWDGAYVNYSYWTVLKGGPNSENAQKLLAFVNRAAIAAEFTQRTSYPGPNTNQLKYLPSDLLPLLSINPDNASKVVHEDSAWLAAKRPDGKTNLEHIGERWLAWRVQ